MRELWNPRELYPLTPLHGPRVLWIGISLFLQPWCSNCRHARHRIMKTEAANLRGEFAELDQSPGSSWLVERRQGELKTQYGGAACQCKKLYHRWRETLGRVRRAIMEKRQRSPLPVNGPRLTPPVRIERPVYMWGMFSSVLQGQPTTSTTSL